jgi:hypothetical protein
LAGFVQFCINALFTHILNQWIDSEQNFILKWVKLAPASLPGSLSIDPISAN